MTNKNRLQVQLIQVFAAERCITSHSDPFKWFIENKAVIRNDLTKAGIRIDAFELWLRWQSPMGQDCTKAIIRYIRERQELTIEESNKRYAMKPIEEREILFAVIDFSDFSFLHQDSIITLEDFYRAHYTSSRLYGSIDLRGIDLLTRQ